MAVRARHSKTSAVPDSGDTNLVQPSDWNADHPITADGPGLIGRVGAGAGAVSELSASDGRTLLGLGTAATQNTGTSGATVPLLDGNNTHSGTNNFGAGIGVGTSTLAGFNINVQRNITGATTAYHQFFGGAVQSDVTGVAYTVRSNVTTAAASFTLPGLVHFAVTQPTFGAGSTVTNQYGFQVNSNMVGATNNYAFEGAIPAGTGRWNLWMSGTANNHMAGALGIGSTVLTGANLRIQRGVTGATTAFAVNVDGLVQSDVTSIAYGYNSSLSTAAASFTLGSLIHFRAAQPTLGAGSAVTNQFGFAVNSSLTGATNNYGFYSDIAAGTGRWNFFAAGTANNAFAGNVRIGSTVAPTNALDVTGSATISGTLSIGGNATSAVQAGTITGQVAVWNQTTGRYEPGSAGAAGAGGTDTQVQFNNAGTLAGAANVTVESNRLVHADYEEFVSQSVPVATPAAGRTRVYTRSRAGRAFLEWIGPSGVDTTAQPAFFNNRIMLIAPNTTTTVTAQGINATTTATLSHPALAATSLAASLYRTRCATNTTAGNAAGIRHGVATMLRGDANARGGFYFHARVCSGSLALAGGEAFIGLSSSVAALAGAPSALADCVGLVKDVADTAWHFVRRTGTGTAQKVALTTPLTYAANQVIDVIIFSRPGGTGLGCTVRSFNNAGVPTTHLDTEYTTDLPAVTTFLAGRFDIRNGATAAAADFDLVRMYAESDF